MGESLRTRIPRPEGRVGVPLLLHLSGPPRRCGHPVGRVPEDPDLSFVRRVGERVAAHRLLLPRARPRPGPPPRALARGPEIPSTMSRFMAPRTGRGLAGRAWGGRSRAESSPDGYCSGSFPHLRPLAYPIPDLRGRLRNRRTVFTRVTPGEPPDRRSPWFEQRANHPGWHARNGVPRKWPVNQFERSHPSWFANDARCRRWLALGVPTDHSTRNPLDALKVPSVRAAQRPDEPPWIGLPRGPDSTHLGLRPPCYRSPSPWPHTGKPRRTGGLSTGNSAILGPR